VEVLVIGGTRFMGYGLTWRLLAGGHRVTLLNRGLTADPFGERVRRLRGDRTTSDLGRLLEGQRFDAAVDLTAYTGHDVAGAVAALAGVGHYVLISTGQVYLVRADCPHPAREEDYEGPLIPAPSSAADRSEWEYGMGKRGAEDVLHEAWRERRFPGTVLRLPVVNGEKDPTRRLESYLWRLLDGGPLLVPEGGRTAPLRHVYARDVVRAIPSLLGRTDTFGRAFNLCQEEAPTLPELLRLLARVLGTEVQLVEVPLAELEGAGLTARGVSPFSSRWISYVDPARAKAELGFRATPLPEAMESIVASFLAHLPEHPPESYAHRPRERELAGTRQEDLA
jgi:nucleoside-diphosphate-sugar epimerase